MGRLAATIAGCLAVACGAPAHPAPPAPAIANESDGAAPMPEARAVAECERTTDLPGSVGGPKPNSMRGIVLDGAGAPADGAQVTIGAPTRTERRGTSTTVHVGGMSQTYTNYTGGFRLESLRAEMVEVTVVYRGTTVTCLRGGEADLRGYVIRVAP